MIVWAMGKIHDIPACECLPSEQQQRHPNQHLPHCAYLRALEKILGRRVEFVDFNETPTKEQQRAA